MNILIIGNGFDLAHKLPTKYSDFLNEIQKDSKFQNYLQKNNKSIKKFNKLMNGKLIKYLLKNNAKHGWIDFENEMRLIIDAICVFPSLLKKHTDLETKEILYMVDKDILKELPPFILQYIYSRKREIKSTWNDETLNKLSQDVFEQIQSFIQIFKEYILWISTEIEIQNIKFFNDLKIDHLLSFNYTDTFMKLYNGNLNEENICYVHGKVSKNIEKGIVMGVGSDYYDENIHEEFLEFFKFFQRYKFTTDNKYLDWINDNDICPNSEKNKVIIYGHSLDPTDRDILKPFFESNRTEIVIYYLDNIDRLKLEKNILKILGKNGFSSYLMEPNSKVKFKKISNNT